MMKKLYAILLLALTWSRRIQCHAGFTGDQIQNDQDDKEVLEDYYPDYNTQSDLTLSNDTDEISDELTLEGLESTSNDIDESLSLVEVLLENLDDAEGKGAESVELPETLKSEEISSMPIEDMYNMVEDYLESTLNIAEDLQSKLRTSMTELENDTLSTTDDNDARKEIFTIMNSMDDRLETQLERLTEMYEKVNEMRTDEDDMYEEEPSEDYEEALNNMLNNDVDDEDEMYDVNDPEDINEGTDGSDVDPIEGIDVVDSSDDQVKANILEGEDGKVPFAQTFLNEQSSIAQQTPDNITDGDVQSNVINDDLQQEANSNFVDDASVEQKGKKLVTDLFTATEQSDVSGMNSTDEQAEDASDIQNYLQSPNLDLESSFQDLNFTALLQELGLPNLFTGENVVAENDNEIPLGGYTEPYPYGGQDATEDEDFQLPELSSIYDNYSYSVAENPLLNNAEENQPYSLRDLGNEMMQAYLDQNNYGDSQTANASPVWPLFDNNSSVPTYGVYANAIVPQPHVFDNNSSVPTYGGYANAIVPQPHVFDNNSSVPTYGGYGSNALERADGVETPTQESFENDVKPLDALDWEHIATTESPPHTAEGIYELSETMSPKSFSMSNEYPEYYDEWPSYEDTNKNSFYKPKETSLVQMTEGATAPSEVAADLDAYNGNGFGYNAWNGNQNLPSSFQAELESYYNRNENKTGISPSVPNEEGLNAYDDLDLQRFWSELQSYNNQKEETLDQEEGKSYLENLWPVNRVGDMNNSTQTEDLEEADDRFGSVTSKNRVGVVHEYMKETEKGKDGPTQRSAFSDPLLYAVVALSVCFFILLVAFCVVKRRRSNSTGRTVGDTVPYTVMEDALTADDKRRNSSGEAYSINV